MARRRRQRLDQVLALPEGEITKQVGVIHVSVDAVVPRVQSAKQNLRTRFGRVIGKAG
jgi:hypothetical protein